MKKILFLCLFAMAPAYLNAQQYHITANLTGFPEQTKFYLKDLALFTDVDSTVLSTSKFALSGKASTPKYYWLYAYFNKKFYYTVLLIGADRVNVSGDARDFPFYVKITGSTSQNYYNINRDATRVNYMERDSLMQLVVPLLNKTDDSSKVLSSRMIKRVKFLDSLRDEQTKAFIATHLNSYAALAELSNLKTKYPKDELRLILAKVKPEFQKSTFAVAVSNYLKVGDVLKKGNQLFDFEAFDSKGKSRRLSEFKGKYILLDFTETYCAPCMLSAEDMRLLEPKYADRLQIVSFYADPNKKIWMEGLKRDKPTWPTLWDGKGATSETLLKYGVTGYPTFVMIDPTGKIMGIWSGYGKPEKGKGSLEEAVDKFLEKK